jgi:hypothetical protein
MPTTSYGIIAAAQREKFKPGITPPTITPSDPFIFPIPTARLGAVGNLGKQVLPHFLF